MAAAEVSKLWGNNDLTPFDFRRVNFWGSPARSCSSRCEVEFASLGKRSSKGTENETKEKPEPNFEFGFRLFDG